MNAPKRKSKSWIVTGLVSIGTIGYAFLVFLPTQQTIAGIRTELAEHRREVLELGTFETEIVALDHRLRAVRSAIHEWQQHAPTEQQIATFVGVVSQLAQQTGARVDRIAPRPAIEMSSLHQHPSDLSVEGSFVQIADFLRALEERSETIWITQLNLTASGETGASVRCELSFTVFADNPDNSG
jgi:Tfp pilus assembly protein PilO